VNINIAFKKSLLPHQLIHIHVKDLEFKNRSISMVQEIIEDESDALCSRSEIQFVLLDAKDHKPVPVSDEIIAKFNQLIHK
jgi:acyl-CoA thioesterase FadM